MWRLNGYKQVAKLQREARAASRLHHKNLVTVIDFGIAGDEPYLVMEYARGTTLNQVLRANGSLPVDTAIGIALQICEGLAHAHHNGVIHCDLNSHNIMIDGKTVDSCQVKILDFGVARIYDSADSSILSLTQSGAFAGNPFYVSPEQCRGGKLDPRTDIYSLGCLLFEMLTGKPPYVGDDIAETITMHINAPVPVLINKGDADFSSKLKNVVAQAISKNREDRYATVEDLRAALIDAKDSSDHMPHEDWQQKTITLIRKDRTIAKRALLLFFCVLCAGLAVYIVMQHQAQQANDRQSGESKLSSRYSPFDRHNESRKALKLMLAREPENIKLVGMSISDEDLKLFQENDRVKMLDLSNTKITDDGLRFLRNSAITELTLDGTGVHTLKNVHYAKQLRSIRLYETDVDDQAIKNLAG